MIGRSLPGMLFNPMILLGNVSLPGRCSLLRQFIRFAAWGAICWAPSQALAADSVKPSEKPNIVFILADDLGWSDTTLNGTTRLYRTPNLERLAKRGMTFRNAYAASPLCSPTRASIMTGLYPGRIGITDPSGANPAERLEATLVVRGQPDQPSQHTLTATRLKHEYFTLAEALREAGYRTAHFGKWHLGLEPYDALHQGFDVDIPHTPDASGPGGGYLAPWKFIKNPHFTGQPGEHIEDRMSQEAARFIRENKERPFYVNYWAYSVHSPWNAKPELIDQYKMQVDSASPQRNPLYAAMVQSLDDAVGRLIDAVDEAGIADRTVMIFFSDNGGYAWPPKQTDPPGYAEIPATSNAPCAAARERCMKGARASRASLFGRLRQRPDRRATRC